MGATAGSVGYGSTFSYDTAGYVAVAEVISISGPNITTDDIEFSSMDSDDGFKESKPGLSDGGDVTITVIFNDTILTTVWGYIRTAKNYRITWSDGSTWTFAGYLKDLSNEASYDGKVEWSMTFKVNGKPEFANAL